MKHKKTISLLMTLLIIGILVPVKPMKNISGSNYLSFVEAKKARKVSKKTHLRRYNYLISLGITESFIKQYTTERLKSSDVKSIVDLWNGENSNSNVKVYNFTLSGTCTDADATIASDPDDPDDYELYRKFSIPEISISDMPKLALYKKKQVMGGFSGDLWASSSQNEFLITDGYIWLSYGYPDDNGSCDIRDIRKGDYRLFIYE